MHFYYNIFYHYEIIYKNKSIIIDIQPIRLFYPNAANLDLLSEGVDMTLLLLIYIYLKRYGFYI